MKRSLPLALAAVLALSAPALAEAAPPASAVQLDMTAGAARNAAMFGDTEVLARIAAAGSPVAGWPADDRVRLSEFLGQSVQFTTVRGDGGVTAWFNPIADAWLVARWAPAAGGGWRMTGLGVTTSDALSGAAASTPWFGRGPTLAASVALQGDRGRALFKAFSADDQALAAITDPTRLRAAWAALRPTLAGQEKGLVDAALTDGYLRYDQAVDEAFVAETAAMGGDEALRRQIMSLPSEQRLTLTAVASFRRADGLSFLIQSPVAPGQVFVAHFTRTGGQPARLVRIDIVNLLKDAS